MCVQHIAVTDILLKICAQSKQKSAFWFIQFLSRNTKDVYAKQDEGCF